MRSRPLLALSLWVFVLSGHAPEVQAGHPQCDNTAQREDINADGVGGTGQQPEVGGVGGTGRGPHEEPVAAGGIGGTGIVAAIRGEATLCLAGVALETNSATVVVRGGSPASAASLRAGDLVLAVGALHAGVLDAERVEVLGRDDPATHADLTRAALARIRAAGVHALLIESRQVHTRGENTLSVAGLEFGASAELVRRSRQAPNAQQRIHAQRGAEGRYRATRVEVLTARPTHERPQGFEKPLPVPPTPPVVRPDSAPSDRRPDIPVVPQPPVRPDLVRPPERPERNERPPLPARPDLPLRPERPERPDLPPRPDFERLQPVTP